MTSVVSVFKTKPDSVLEDYNNAMELAEAKKALPKSKETILKLNLSWTKFYPACSSPPWQLDGVLKFLEANNYKEIHAVENCTVVTDVMEGAKLNKWLPVLKSHNLKFEPLTEVKWIDYEPKAEMLAMNDIFPDGFQIPKMFIGKNVIHLPTMKTHGHTVMTGAIKNAFGGLITKRRHHCHKMIHEVIVDLLQIQKEIHPGIFAVMDGTVCGDGNGPRTMIPVEKNYILASGDQVAIDAISAKMMGFDPLKIPFIKKAHDLGLGCGDPKQISIVGEDISNINFHFKTGKSPVIFFDQLFRKKMKVLEPILFHTPLFKMCVLGSAMYHDNIWYNTVGRQRVRQFMGSGWGKLFNSY